MADKDELKNFTLEIPVVEEKGKLTIYQAEFVGGKLILDPIPTLIDGAENFQKPPRPEAPRLEEAMRYAAAVVGDKMLGRVEFGQLTSGMLEQQDGRFILAVNDDMAAADKAQAYANLAQLLSVSRSAGEAVANDKKGADRLAAIAALTKSAEAARTQATAEVTKPMEIPPSPVQSDVAIFMLPVKEAGNKVNVYHAQMTDGVLRISEAPLEAQDRLVHAVTAKLGNTMLTHDAFSKLVSTFDDKGKNWILDASKEKSPDTKAHVYEMQAALLKKSIGYDEFGNDPQKNPEVGVERKTLIANTEKLAQESRPRENRMDKNPRGPERIAEPGEQPKQETQNATQNKQKNTRPANGYNNRDKDFNSEKVREPLLERDDNLDHKIRFNENNTRYVAEFGIKSGMDRFLPKRFGADRSAPPSLQESQNLKDKTSLSERIKNATDRFLNKQNSASEGLRNPSKLFDREGAELRPKHIPGLTLVDVDDNGNPVFAVAKINGKSAADNIKLGDGVTKREDGRYVVDIGNQKLAMSEYEQTRVNGAAAKRMLDVNRDGIISKYERDRANPDQLNALAQRADLDGNGLSERETKMAFRASGFDDHNNPNAKKAQEAFNDFKTTLANAGVKFSAENIASVPTEGKAALGAPTVALNTPQGQGPK